MSNTDSQPSVEKLEKQIEDIMTSLGKATQADLVNSLNNRLAMLQKELAKKRAA